MIQFWRVEAFAVFKQKVWGRRVSEYTWTETFLQIFKWMVAAEAKGIYFLKVKS